MSLELLTPSLPFRAGVLGGSKRDDEGHDEQCQDRDGRMTRIPAAAAVFHGGMEGVLLVAALVGEAVRDFLVGSGHDRGRRVPQALEHVRVDAMTDTDGVLNAKEILAELG